MLTVVILSAIVAIVSVFIPFNRRRDAINTLGEQSLSEGDLACVVTGIL